MSAADENGHIDLDEVVAVKYLSHGNVEERKIPDAFKRNEILPYLTNIFIIFYDKFGNGYSRIIY
tara:strand:- start:1040 stop:1234 length:195 start_codon:yes stop_codon:yes gene_type:complete